MQDLDFMKELEYLRATGGLVVVLDRHGRVVFLNQKGCELLECDEATVIGLNWFETFLPEAEQERIRPLFLSLVQFSRAPVDEFENVLRTAKGNLRMIKWHNTTVIQRDGVNDIFICFGEDQTEKKALLEQLTRQQEARRKQLLSAAIDAQEKVRSDLARELHDNVNQILTTCTLLLNQEQSTNHPSELVGRAAHYLKQAINEIRNISHQLNPLQLGEIGLIRSIEDLVASLESINDFTIETKLEDPEGLLNEHASLSLALFRIIQEQLNNVMKYAKATRVGLRLEAGKESIDLEIRDNGIGFDAETVNKGLGLRSIYSRVELLNGQVYLDTAPGQGCLLSVFLPLNHH